MCPCWQRRLAPPFGRRNECGHRAVGFAGPSGGVGERVDVDSDLLDRFMRYVPWMIALLAADMTLAAARSTGRILPS